MTVAKRYTVATRGLTPVVVREAAAILGETERTLRKQIAAGRYPLLAGPQSRERVLLPIEVIEDHARRQQGRHSIPDPPASTPPQSYRSWHSAYRFSHFSASMRVQIVTSRNTA
jgi:hypothetical protein